MRNPSGGYPRLLLESSDFQGRVTAGSFVLEARWTSTRLENHTSFLYLVVAQEKEMGRVQDKVVLVTGGVKGLGKASAKMLLAEGATVLLGYYDADFGNAIADELGDNCHFIRLDVTDWNQWLNAIGEIEQKFGRLDVLINNAAITVQGSIAELTPDDFRRCFTYDVDSIFMGCKAAIPLISKDGGGSIINVSSAAGNKAAADFTAYNSAKAAVVMLTKSIALWCARERNGVRVNCLQPGTIMTPNVERVISESGDPTATRAYLEQIHPIGHMGEPDDVAHLVVYLASHESKFATGAPFVIDGGLSIS